MANCQLTPVFGDNQQQQQSETTITNNVDDDVLATIPEGRVGQVCKEWLIREDGNLAYRLQNEEITQHYKENRSKNQIVRQDIPLAKHLQQNEILEAQRKYENKLREQLDHDERIARKIEHRLWLEEEAAKKAAEEADEKLAKKLMEKEKAKQLKKRLEKEKQQVEKLSAQLGADFRLESTNEISGRTLDRFARSSSGNRIMTEDEQELDLSEFCMPPPPGLTPEELKLFLEEQDAEIARLLQHQELKRSRNPEKEKLAQIEAQDYAIAKMLQKMEKERSKRIREKHRMQQLRNQSSVDNDLNFQRTSTPLNPNIVDTVIPNPNLKPENDYDIPENHLVQMQNIHDETYEEPYQILDQQPKPSLSVAAATTTTSAQNFHNIAIDLDPTYKRRSKLKSSSQGDLIESCVDDEETRLMNSHRQQSTESPSSSTFVQRLRDSFEKLPRSSTTSSRSSDTSSGSRKSNTKSPSQHLSNQIIQDDQPPPLPPRDGSLMSHFKDHDNSTTTTIREPAIIKTNNKIDHNNLLPPHHPQHPNRRFNNIDSSSSTLFHPIIAPVQGHRRSLFSTERPFPATLISNTPPNNNKSKSKNQDGCKTQ